MTGKIDLIQARPQIKFEQLVARKATRLLENWTDHMQNALRRKKEATTRAATAAIIQNRSAL